MRTRTKALVLVPLAAVLAGCATPRPEDALVEARRLAPQGGELRLATDEAARRERESAVARALAEPLDAQGAWRVALLNSPALQALIAQS